MDADGAPLYLGIDVGTSGVRAVAIDAAGDSAAQAARRLPAPLCADGAVSQDPALWWAAVEATLGEIVAAVGGARIAAISVDGTSGTLLLTDALGRPLGEARMYNDAGAAHLSRRIKKVAPPESGAHGATSPLARLMVMQAAMPEARHALHQADWIAGRLLGRMGLSDENNALKLGYDPVARCWPAWLDELGVRRELLPEVREPGTTFGVIAPETARNLGLHGECLIVAGTTDGCASFIATGAAEPGDGVTALGSTLTLKLLADRPIFAPEFGVYSHRLGDRWLAGGASNTGGAALERFFTPERMAELTPQLRPEQPMGRAWHPLPGKGERFPVAEPDLTFEPTDRPASDVGFFQALLEGIAAVEVLAYARLTELGGPPLRSVRTVGGGAGNEPWHRIRSARLRVPMPSPTSLEAAYGTALLARQGARRG